MTKRRKNILTTMAALAVVLVGLWLFVHREPRYNGKSLSQWADMGLKATDQQPWNTNDVLVASNAIRQIGPKALALALAYEWSGKLPSWSPIDEKINELSDQVGWMERFPNGNDRIGYGSFLLRPFERGRFVAYALQEDMVSDSKNSFWQGHPRPERVLDLFNDRTLVLAMEQLPPNAAPEVATAILREISASGRDKSTFGPALWAYFRSTTNRETGLTALRTLAGSGFRAEETALILARLPLTTNRADGQILDALRELGPIGWPYLARSLTNELPLVRRKAFEGLALEWTEQEITHAWTPEFRVGNDSRVGWTRAPSTNRLEFMATQSEELRSAFVEQVTENFPSKPKDFSAENRTNAVVMLSRFTNDPSPPIAARSLEALRKINALPPAQ